MCCVHNYELPHICIMVGLRGYNQNWSPVVLGTGQTHSKRWSRLQRVSNLNRKDRQRMGMEAEAERVEKTCFFWATK